MNFETPRKNYASIAIITAAHLLAAFIAVKNSTIMVGRSEPPVIDVIPRPEQPRQPDPVPEKEFELPKRNDPIIVEKPIVEPPPTIIDDITNHKREPGEPAVPPARGNPDDKRGKGDSGEAVRQAPVRVAPVIDAANCARPAYPAAALRNGDEGKVTLAFLVGADGRIASARIDKTSGHRDLDRAALQGLSMCSFKPGTVDGVPFESWARIEYSWTLDD